jgi:hypothetical protein
MTDIVHEDFSGEKQGYRKVLVLEVHVREGALSAFGKEVGSC